MSGTTVTWAHHSLLEDDRKGFIQGLWATVLLGFFFTLLQIYEYQHASFDFSGHIYGATFYMATGFHGFHVVVGTIFWPSVCGEENLVILTKIIILDLKLQHGTGILLM